ncbi:DUF1024 family protein [Mammaliicoccus sciuri]|uniref:DUF1024 family protein n=1 Tax=Mammaliicoccus sciuri TaxID=1296 RepID=UPI000D1DDD8E|nr:DUF1024 family protein [Mammaliicoccus sciuri]PTK27544.1 hypothetical protein BUZ86_05555 [Mammaliicoccus sciuri]
MAYEYEDTVVAELTSLGMQYNSNAHYEMADEVEEVYAKAKAFDEIKDVIKKAEFYDRDTALDIIEIVEDLEDK